MVKYSISDWFLLIPSVELIVPQNMLSRISDLLLYCFFLEKKKRNEKVYMIQFLLLNAICPYSDVILGICASIYFCKQGI